MKPSPMTTSPSILGLDSILADLPLAGGKGANLARLKRAMYPVPDGFILTTQAYRDFLAAHGLSASIETWLRGVDLAQPESLEHTSEQIRALFSAGKLSEEFAAQLRTAYQDLGDGPVAVRSSATAEDLPDLSFAGQQDTFLNVVGSEQLRKAVVNCWSSLWTARAIGYRLRNGIDQAQVALAVVVQAMIQSEAAGVMFTANPLSGLRAETVIDATLGLGEALVSGQLEPDHYVVNLTEERILFKKLGAKEISIHGVAAGGTRTIEKKQGDIQALPDEQIIRLAKLGGKATQMFGFPQDIEWAWAGGELYLLQSRPITALFPLPEGLPAGSLRVFSSFAAVQGMLDPVTPVGRAAIKQIFASASRLFGLKVTPETQQVMQDAGERLWADITPILSNSIGRKAVPVVLSMVEPGMRQAVEQVLEDPRLQPGRPGVSWGARRKLVRFLIPAAANVFLNMLFPRQRREYIVERGEQVIALMEKRCAAVQGDRWQKLAQRARLLPDLAERRLGNTFRLFFSGVAAGMASWNLLDRLVSGQSIGQPEGQATPSQDLILQVTRGMPYNPTTEMDLKLWELAKMVRADPASLLVLQNGVATDLAQRYLAGGLPKVTRQAVGEFLRVYGSRGFCEIDLGRPRWVDDPTHVFEMLLCFLQIEDATQAPDVVFARGADSAQKAIDQLAAAVRKRRHGWLKTRLVHFLSGRARQLMGARESPKFFAVRMMGLIQQALRQSGEEFVQSGELSATDDLFYLTFAEQIAFATRADRNFRGLIRSRREVYNRELLRRQIPRLLLSDGRAFYAGIQTGEPGGDEIYGSPVSPGTAQGRVRVVLNPCQAGLQPGEILVCPGTDPSWTPLFLTAGGLVMETGGMMTHGAVVAREYGIPAIVGVDRATERLHTGELIRIDGSTGVIYLTSIVNNTG